MEIRECFTIRMEDRPIARFYTKEAAIRFSKKIVEANNLDRIMGIDIKITNDCFKDGIEQKYFRGDTVWEYKQRLI